ncbi:hypothetical protein J5N97_005371 [Dioscorea zingiberensis]|uniref:Uncharacterized protein n=1 Tax=Dioscorea zingiberensis TaxID=325984 RepID=A0A9D5HRU8_9LILI|nr:hypothetical protein J5N97_005371 [Dioscorea zingiberensis]
MDRPRSSSEFATRDLCSCDGHGCSETFPGSKVTIGPWIDNGFYYDFDMEPLTDKDLKRIKKEMDRIVNRKLPLIREEVSRDVAQERSMALNDPYKLEILESIKEEPITI